MQMTKTPLLQSRRFWLTILDTVISLITLIAGAYFPENKELTIAIVAILQPVFIALIIALTVDDAQQVRMQTALKLAGK
jgi:hypothetical protein